jgi:predicted nucleotide-binding protein
VLGSAKSQRASAAASKPGATLTRKKVVLILCSRNGTVRQAIGRFGNQMNLAMEIVDYYPEEPHRFVENMFEHRDAQFAIVYWSEPNERETPGFAHPERYVGFVLGFILGRLGRGRVFVLGSARTHPLPGFERIALSQLDSTGSWQIQLARRMKAAGIVLDISRLV